MSSDKRSRRRNSLIDGFEPWTTNPFHLNPYAICIYLHVGSPIFSEKRKPSAILSRVQKKISLTNSIIKSKRYYITVNHAQINSMQICGRYAHVWKMEEIMFCKQIMCACRSFDEANKLPCVCVCVCVCVFQLMNTGGKHPLQRSYRRRSLTPQPKRVTDMDRSDLRKETLSKTVGLQPSKRMRRRRSCIDIPSRLTCTHAHISIHKLQIYIHGFKLECLCFMGARRWRVNITN